MIWIVIQARNTAILQKYRDFYASNDHYPAHWCHVYKDFSSSKITNQKSSPPVRIYHCHHHGVTTQRPWTRPCVGTQEHSIRGIKRYRPSSLGYKNSRTKWKIWTKLESFRNMSSTFMIQLISARQLNVFWKGCNNEDFLRKKTEIAILFICKSVLLHL